MRIELTKEQYDKLLELVYLGNWMANSYRTEDELEEYNKAEQLFYSYFERFNAQDKIKKDEDTLEYYPTQEFEQNSQELIDEYDNDTFWDQLALRLAEKEVLSKNSGASFEQIMRAMEKYEDELEESGFEKVSFDWKKKK